MLPMNRLTELNSKILAETAGTEYKDRRLVFGDGNISSSIVLIGEAPGKNEEEQGKPFIGAAGKNLNEFLEILSIDRDDLYITNVVKLRPCKISIKTSKPINRPPSVEEINFFTPYLIEEINLIKPRIVVTLGSVALNAILIPDNKRTAKKISIGEYHGKIVSINDYVLFPLYHPASVIYNRSLRDIYLNDLHKLKNLLI